ncbi:C40 family peptidase [Vibrio hippocampi]|uniref:D-gamma-glutamyl-meso-diaminopimelic acid endopeptidase CwlS n=1 Tax=Vibrio hippocampi TaxID=654686 RepID=A0ABM8ZMR2_9VIBR|nr:C40 family peptidase [Vibrio hippocampi]CAH0529831.1 D-gamma-glutamyl-meso-diaminopimelic acid endopeptidase CwlS [Vibrio hippocampi]
MRILFLSIFLVACASNPVNSARTDRSLEHNQQQLVSFARGYIGSDYVWGGSSPSGFDCSGFIQYVYGHFNIPMPRTTSQYTSLYANKINIEQAQVGDLIVFTGTDPKIRKPGHAGIITEVGVNSLSFIHSSSSKKHYGVTETSFFNSGYPKRYITVIRIDLS